MLTGVDQRLTHYKRPSERTEDGRRFHEIGTGTNHVKDMHVELGRGRRSRVRVLGV